MTSTISVTKHRGPTNFTFANETCVRLIFGISQARLSAILQEACTKQMSHNKHSILMRTEPNHSESLQPPDRLRMRRFVSDSRFQSNYFELKIKKPKKRSQNCDKNMQQACNTYIFDNAFSSSCSVTTPSSDCSMSVTSLQRLDSCENQPFTHDFPNTTLNNSPSITEMTPYEDRWKGILPLKPVIFNADELLQLGICIFPINTSM